MKKLFGLLLTAALLTLPLTGIAQAQKIDFGKFTCGDFIKLAEAGDGETIAALYMWLDGYISAKSGNTETDLSAVESNLEEVLKVCKGKKGTKILTAIGAN